MGFDAQGIRFLVTAQRSGVAFTNTAMIGRQEIFIDPALLHRVLSGAQLIKTRADTDRVLTEANGYAEPLLRLLGAEDITSVDASPYERASVVHDMNEPIPDALKGRFSVVIDAGTLEHVFNFPTAIRNCMEMVKVGGHLILMTPANNFMGHGFYQFSPELFFRVCSSNNGYQINQAIFCEVDPGSPWYRVADPAQAGRRVEWVNSRPSYLLIQAQRLQEVPVLTEPPQQSDYRVLWQSSDPRSLAAHHSKAPLYRRLLRRAASTASTLLRNAEPAGLATWRKHPDPEVFTRLSHGFEDQVQS
jgi:hypothetical protein